MPLFPYKWNLSDGYPAQGIIQHNKKVFTTFSCGGGSSMGYKLAGYNVFAANDIDPQMQRVYEANHHPKYYYLAPIKDLINKTDWPDEFKDLDVLDGSPPCSTFSMAGLRDKAWGKEKHFREGQAKQVLDDLFFDFIELARMLQPKIIIAENVKGMTQGNAKGYLVEIFKQMDLAGYTTQLFLLNAATMGVPQRRERVFFLAHRKDLVLPKIQIRYNESSVFFKEISDTTDKQTRLTELYQRYWSSSRQGDSVGKFAQKRKMINNGVCNTLTASGRHFHPEFKRELNDQEIMKIGSWPLDYTFEDIEANYLVGMSVPPVMTAQVANQVYLQWLSKV